MSQYRRLDRDRYYRSAHSIWVDDESKRRDMLREDEQSPHRFPLYSRIFSSSSGGGRSASSALVPTQEPR